MTKTYCIGGQNVSVSSVYDEVHRLCAGYVAPNAKADFVVSTTEEDIAFERERSEAEDKREGLPVRYFSDEYLETLAVYRKIAERMPEYNTLLFHGSCVAVDGEGFLFVANSGVGKSTHVSLWRKLFAERAEMVNDDKPLIRILESGATAFGTPWDGKHHLSNNISVPLKAVCLVERAKENFIEELSQKDAFSVLLQYAYRPFTNETMGKTLSLVSLLSRLVRVYRLHCNRELDAAKVSYFAMKGESL